MGKKEKKKGIIRTGAIVPLVIFVGLTIAYFTFLFDGHLRKGIEYGATYSYRAEINVAQLKIHWLQPGISIYGVQVTDRDTPEQNIVEVGVIRLKLLWDGLLRGKFVVPESTIADIKIKSKRDRPGRVLPKKVSQSQEPGIIDQAADKTINHLKEKNKSNFLSDIVAVADGENYKSQLKKMEGALQSSARAKELEKELKAKEKEWKKKIDSLPNESEIKKLSKRVSGFKFNSKNPKEMQKSLKELDKIYKDARSKYKNVEGAKKAFDKDMKAYKNTYADLEKMVKKDIDSLAKKMNIPSLDPQEITKMLLGNMVASQLGNVEKYKKLAREYMPTNKKNSKANAIAPEARAKGRNYRFLRTKSYPKFWLQKAIVSSKSTESGFSGDVKGVITNLTDAPEHLGLPTKANIQGDFPHSEIFGLVADITIDHTTENSKESAVISVAKFPVSSNTFTKTKDVEFGYRKALGQSKMTIDIVDGALNIDSKSLFNEVDYVVEAQSNSLKRILTNVSKQLKGLDLNIRAKGSWDDLSLHINSNLGQKLADAIKGQVDAQIKKARQDIKNHVNGLMGKEKKKINGKIAELEKKHGISLKNKDQAIKSLESQIEKKKKSAIEGEKKKAEKKLKKDADKEIDKLKKKFKLKF